jgi:hypothetical protein
MPLLETVPEQPRKVQAKPVLSARSKAICEFVWLKKVWYIVTLVVSVAFWSICA